jgi:hypothetical protein
VTLDWTALCAESEANQTKAPTTPKGDIPKKDWIPMIPADHGDLDRPESWYTDANGKKVRMHDLLKQEK